MIKYKKVSKIYGDIVALKDASFNIEEGEFIFLVGPSGCGKTTIIKLLIKEEIPSEGSIFYYSYEVPKLKTKLISELRREIGVIFQDFKLLPNKTISENIAFAMEASGKKDKDIKETTPFLLELVGLKDRINSFPQELSGGEKQKIAIARAMANDPKVLVADEPTGNLDEKSSWEIVNLLNKINEGGTTVIMATHGNQIVNTLGKRTIKFDKGILVEDTALSIRVARPLEGKVEIKNEEDYTTGIIDDNGVKEENRTKKPEEETVIGEENLEEIITDQRKPTTSSKDKPKDTDDGVQFIDEDEDQKKEVSEKGAEKSESLGKDTKSESLEGKDTDESNSKSSKNIKITFSTKRQIKPKKFKYEIELLNLSKDIKLLLSENNITTIAKLVSLNDSKLQQIQGMNESIIKKIKKALKQFNK